MLAHACALLNLHQSASAIQTVPYKLNFQGRLADTLGAPKPNGTYNMKIRIYDAASGGTLQWSEERAVSNGTGVVVAGSLGLFSIQLGDVSSLSPSLFTNPNLYLEVELPTPATATCAGAGCASYTEGAMTPRNKFGSTAYAFSADTIDGIDSANLGQLNGTNVWTGPNQVKLNSGVALNVQNASSQNAFNVDTATSKITLGVDTTLAAGKSLTLAGGITASRPASPTEGMIYYDTDIKQLLTYANGKWQADGKDAVIVAASNSSAADKAAADYIADGTGDQTEINSALTAAAPGGTRKTGRVVLLGGTYTASATILIPNNTTLSGVGTATLVQLADIDATDNLIENSDATTGTGIAIENLRLDGQKSLNTAGTQQGIYLSNMGAGNGGGARQGAKITNSTISNFRDSGLYLNASSNNNLAGITTQNNGHSGFYVVASNNNTITGSNAQGNTNSGFYITASSNNSLTDNFSQGNANSGYLLNVGSSNTLTGNTAQGNTNAGFNIDVSSSNSLTGNTAQGNAGSGFFFNSSPNNTVSGNSAQANTTGFYLNASPANTLTANTIVDSTNYGVYLLNSNNNTVTGMGIHNSGGGAANNAIYGDTADGNIITNNTITDTSATTNNYAINFSNSTSDQNYLADNRFSSTPGTSTINDAGTGTVYANQARAENGGQLTNRTANSATAFQIQNASGTSLFNVDTTNSELEIGSATTGVRLSSNKLNFGDGTGWTFDIAGGGGNIISLTDNSGIILRKDTAINGSNSGLLVTTGASASGAVMVSRSGGGATGSLLELQKSDGNVLAKFDVNGNLTVGGGSSSASTTALLVQNTSSAAIFSVDTTNSRVVIGNTSTTGVVLVLGNKTTAGDPTGVEGSMYYNSFLKAFRCYQNDGWRNCNSPSYEVLDIEDEFMTGMMDGEFDSLDFQRHVGELNWICDSDEYDPGVDTDYGCNVNTASEDAGHPGVIQLQTIHTGAASWSASMNLRPIALSDFDQATYIVKTQSVYTASSAIVGLVNDSTGLAYPNGGIYFEYDGSSSVWRAKAKVGGVETNVSTGVSLANSTWYRLQIRKIGSTYYYYINGTQVATISTNIPTLPQTPYFGVWNRNSTEEGKLRIDYFSMRSKTLSR